MNRIVIFCSLGMNRAGEISARVLIVIELFQLKVNGQKYQGNACMKMAIEPEACQGIASDQINKFAFTPEK